MERRSINATEEDIGLRLVESKSILREIQRALLQDQVEEIGELARVCRSCGSYLPVHDRRHRGIDTLFGRFAVDVPRVRMCMCGLPGFPEFKAACSPLTRLIPDNATPELRRLQAELGARHSYREAAGWRNGAPVTVLSDGDPALPRLVRDAIRADVRHILDWWHISIRIRHVETTFQTLLSQLEPTDASKIGTLVQHLRWRIWHGQTARALDALETLFRFAMRMRHATIGGTSEAAMTATARTMELKTYLEYNRSAVINYAHRRRQGKVNRPLFAGG